MFNTISVLVLVVGVVVVGIAALLLGRTLVLAHSLSAKAAVIASTGRGINTSTDSVIQLDRTNQTAASILESAKPLGGALSTIVATAGDINTVAGSINGSAGAINGVAKGINGSASTILSSARTINANADGIKSSAGSINDVAKGINDRAADILDVARKVNTDAKDINGALDKTIDVAKDIKKDTGNIGGQGTVAVSRTACVADKLYLVPGASPSVGGCNNGTGGK